MKKRGTMLPPSADTIRIATFANVCAWRRVAQAAVSASASPAAETDGGGGHDREARAEVARQVHPVQQPGHDEDHA